MSNSPRLSIVNDLLQHATTPNALSKCLQNVTMRRKIISPEPTEIIDLTTSPISTESYPVNGSSHDHSYNVFVKDLNLNSTYSVKKRCLHPNWKCSQAKQKYDLLPDICSSGPLRRVRSWSYDQRIFMSPRTPNVQKYLPKQLLKPSPAKLSVADSPFTPKNAVELRPLRGYRLQDVLHRRPITPDNYYKNSQLYVEDRN